MRVCLALVFLLLAPGASAQEGDSARDDAIFGGDSPAEGAPESSGRDEGAIFGGDSPESPGDTGRDEDAIFGDEGTDTSTETPAATPESRDDAVLGQGAEGIDGFQIIEDTLAIGGIVYMRTAYSILQDNDIEDNTLSMPNLLDVYLDARPGERVRAYVRGRMSYDPTIDPDGTGAFGQPVGDNPDVLLDQLWLKFDIARAVFMTLGKQPIRWGTARLWNPVDVVNAARRDPLALFDERTGVTLVKVHVPVESLGWNFYLVGMMDEASGLDKIGVAGRAEFVIETAELSLSAVYQKGRKPRVGFDFSAGIGDVDLYGEVGVAFGLDGKVWEGTFDVSTFTLPNEQDVSDDVAVQVAWGLNYGVNYTDEDVLYLGVEAFWNQRGYQDESLYPWLLYQSSQGQGGFQPFYLGEWYTALYLLLPSPGEWDDGSITFSTLANLSDLSFISRLDLTVRVLTWLDIQTYVSGHYGTKGGEFRFAVDIPAVDIPGVLSFPGVEIKPQLIDLGLNLRVSI